MKTVVNILLLLLLPALLVAAQTPAQRFTEALASYKGGQYAHAIEILEKLAADGYDGYEVQYNLGNACYKNGDIGKSVLAFERALRLRPNDPDATHNVNVVRARTRDRVEPMPLIFFVQWWNDVKSSRLPDEFFTWSIAFLWLTVIAAFVFFGFRARGMRRIALVAGILFAVFFAVSLSLYNARLTELRQHRFAVVMAPQVSVKSAPDESGIETFVVHEGLTVEILGSRNGLLRIRLADGKSGWVTTGAVERI